MSKKKDYDLVANVLSYSHGLSAIEIAKRLADEFAIKNPGFNKDKFLEKSGLILN